MARKNNTLEGGSNGTAISVANSGGASGDPVTSVDATSPNYSTAAAFHGALGFICVSSVTSRFIWTTGFGAGVNGALRFYYWTESANPTANVQIVSIRTAAGQSSGLNHNSAGNFNCVNSAGTGITGTASAQLPLSTCLRVEMETISSATVGQVLYRYYVGDSQTAIASFVSAATQNTRGGNLIGPVIGNHSGGNWGYSARFDDPSYQESLTPLGPTSSHPSNLVVAQSALIRASSF